MGTFINQINSANDKPYHKPMGKQGFNEESLGTRSTGHEHTQIQTEHIRFHTLKSTLSCSLNFLSYGLL